MQVTTVGLDLAKNIFQVHWITADGTVAYNKSLRRAQLMQFFEKLEPCLIGLEACGSSHHWARQFRKQGHEVRLMPAMYVKTYVKRGKPDAIDAEAICEAVTRPTMRFVAIKTEEQQGVLFLLRARSGRATMDATQQHAARPARGVWQSYVAKDHSRGWPCYRLGHCCDSGRRASVPQWT